MPDRPLALVTGASSGIGLELARVAAAEGHDLVVASDDGDVEEAARRLRGLGASVEAVRADLSTEAGVLDLWAALGARDLDVLCANAGRTLGHAFADQDWPRVAEVVGLNVLGTTLLLHRALPRMLARGRGRVLVTGSIAGFVPGSHQAVYNASKAYLDSLSYALRDELSGTGVTLTCLMPGPVDTPVFERGDMADTPVGRTGLKSDPAVVARAGWDGMMAGQAGVTPGLANKLAVTLSGLVPAPVLARLNRWVSEPDDTGS